MLGVDLQTRKKKHYPHYVPGSGVALSQIYAQKSSFLRECQGDVCSKDMPHMRPEKRCHGAARTHCGPRIQAQHSSTGAIAIGNRKYAMPRAVSRLDISKSSRLLYHPTSEPQQSRERGHSRLGKPFQGLVTTLPRVLSVTRNTTPNLGLCLLTK